MKSIVTFPSSSLLFCIIFFGSCDEKEPSNGECRLTSSSNTVVSGNYSYNSAAQLTGFQGFYVADPDFTVDAVIEYDSEQRIVRVTSTEETYVTVDYSDDGRTATTTTFIRGIAEPSEDYVFQFDDAGKLVKRISLEDANSFSTFEYNADGDLKFEYAWSGEEHYLANEIISYDNQKIFNVPVSFYVSMVNAETIDFVPQIDFIEYKHNPMERTYYEPDGTVQSSVNVSYEYNGQGYPVKMTGAFPGTSIAFTYGYDCE